MAGLAIALGLEPNQTVSAIGGGGKMPLLSALALDWASAGGTALVTTTTRMFGLNLPGGLELLSVADPGNLDTLLAEHRGPGRAIVLGRVGPRRDLLEGFDERAIEEARVSLGADLVLVKADGSRGRGLKAHQPTEPVIPPRTGVVIAVAGISALGLPIKDETVHRSALFCERWGYAPGEPIDDEAYARALGDPEGYRRTVSARMRYLVFLNQADSPNRVEGARRIARLLASRGVEAWWGDARAGRAERA